MRSDRVLVWALVIVLVLVLIPLLGMVGMMGMHGTMGTGMMGQMGGMMNGGMMGWGFVWMVLVAIALGLFIAFLIRAASRE
jgi:hypothetical protein